MSARPEGRPSTLSDRAKRSHPAIPREARDAPPAAVAPPAVVTQQVNFRADVELVRQVKARLALEGRTMQDLLTGHLRPWLSNDKAS